MLQEAYPVDNLIMILQSSVDLVAKQGKKRNGSYKEMLNMTLVLGNYANCRPYNFPKIRSVSSTAFIICYLATVEPQTLCIKWYLNTFLRNK